jgi:hypothetical protein
MAPFRSEPQFGIAVSDELTRLLGAMNRFEEAKCVLSRSAAAYESINLLAIAEQSRR